MKPKALLLSTALGVLLLPSTQAMAQTAAHKGETGATTLEEVIVTAQKREESSLTVPIALTALSGEQLVRQQAFRLEDFVGQVPGLNLTNTLGGTQLVIRGIATGASSINAPVATYIDETPLVGVGAFSGGSADTPNLDAFDIKRIEVLKGPQGTLYGANALGGLLKYITNAPDPSGFSARVQAGVSTVAHGGEGYDLHGMVNVPLSHDLALRLVGYDTEYPGFIDDPSRGLKDINVSRFSGVRGSLLWTPTSALSVRLNTVYQKRTWKDLAAEDVNPGSFSPIFCSLCQARLAGQPGTNVLQYNNVTINWDLGPAKLLSSTTYYRYSATQDRDLSVGYGALATSLFENAFHYPTGPYGFWASQEFNGKSWVQETRLASNGNGPFEWQAGVYYTSKSATNLQLYHPIFVPTKTVLFNDWTIGTETLPTTYKEIAGYANLDYHITPTFDVGVGGRYSHQRQTFEQIGTGLDVSATIPEASMKDDVFTYSADARWRFTPGTMLYARIASGFVPGGPNDQGFTAPVPPTFGPSTTVNYELGLKSSLLDKRLSIELSLFEIDWKKIQLLATIGGYTSFTNGGTARSQGLEWNVSYLPINGLTLDFNGAYTDAHLTEDAPASVGGLNGDRLPITPLWQLSASATYERPLFDDLSGFAGINWRFSGSRYAEFEEPGAGPRQKLPSYQTVDLRAGVETQRWTLAAYIKNVADSRAITYVTDETMAGLLRSPYGGSGPQSAFVVTPRTIGLEFTANF